MHKRCWRIASIFAVIAMLFVPLTACSQGEQYPVKPILYVVPYSPGGGSDIMARLVDKIGTETKAFPQPLVIENKTGGSGVVGKSYAKEKPADGYTIMSADDSTQTTVLFGAAPWAYNDFTLIAKVNVDYQMITVRAGTYKTMKELLDAAKAKPGALKIGGTGTTQNDILHVNMFQKATGVKFNYVSHDSGGAVTTALLGGQVDVGISNPSEVVEQMRAGKIVALGVSSPQRLQFSEPMWKDIPTWTELGIPLNLSMWRGIMGPAKLPAEKVTWLVNALKKITDSPEWKTQYLDKYFQVGVFVTGDALKKEVDDEYTNYKKIMEEIGLKK